MKKLIISIMVALTILTATVASCGSSQESMSDEDGIILSSIDYDNGKMISPGVAYDTGGSEGYYYEDEEYYGDSSTGQSTVSSVNTDYAPPPIAGETIDRMIVRTGNISLVVEDVTGAIDQIKQYADNFGGYVVSSSMWQNDERLAGSITIRVLAENFDTTLQALHGIAVEVTYENTSSQDVTEEYVDLSASLENLEVTRDKLLEIMDRAETVDDILDVQKELTRIEGQIKQTEARMEYLEKTSSTSIIYIQLEQSTMYFEFSADKRRGVQEGEKIEFTVSPISGGFAPYTYLWDFGDDETSTEMNPTHAYNDSGYYTVSLTVTDDDGNVETTARENYITVDKGWTIGNAAGKAWDGLAAFGRWLLEVLVWIGIFSPVWLIIGGLIIWLVRRRRRKNS